jgi:hypothetical protein
LGSPGLLGLGDAGEVVILDAGQVPDQPGDRVGLEVDAEGQLLGREAVDHPVDSPADPAKGIDEQRGAGHRRLLCRKALPRERRDRQVDGSARLQRRQPPEIECRMQGDGLIQ